MTDSGVAFPPNSNEYRERLIAAVSYWSGWCIDEGHDELGWLLMEVKDQMREDRPENGAQDE